MFRMSVWRGISLILMMTGLVGAQEERIFGNSTVFRLFIEQGIFSNAEQGCAGLNDENTTFGFTLGRVDSLEEFNFIIEEFNLKNLDLDPTKDGKSIRNSIWIGLRRFPETSEIEDFSYIDGINTGRRFFADAGELPWASTQPNNIGGVQHCVSWETKLKKGDDLPLRWYDDNCNIEMSAFLCRGEVLQTPSPTPSPSFAPSPNPTDSPSSSPTLKPTVAPSDSPSSSPTTTSEAVAPPDEEDKLMSNIFLSVAGISGTLMFLSLIVLLHEKRDLNRLRRKLNDIELNENLSELALADNKYHAMY